MNGISYRLDVDPRRTLLSVLREELNLTGTKYGCGEGNCGACTVLMGKDAIASCILPAKSVEGQDITTIEGLASDGKLNQVQEAFLECTAFQCGYCTPGFIIEATALLLKTPNPDGNQIRSALDGHICRCNTYVRILQAVKIAADYPTRLLVETDNS